MIIQALRRHARQQPDSVALSGDDGSLNYATLNQRVTEFGEWLVAQQIATLGIRLDNGPDWIVADLAGLYANIAIVPVPSYFTPDQVAYLIESAGIECIVENDSADLKKAPGLNRAAVRKTSMRSAGHPGCKITFTSGSTGMPKGVVLPHEKLGTIAASIVTAMELIDVEKHLCVLPLATLLENVAGVYAPLIKGIEISVPSPEMTGLQGSSGLDVEKFSQCLDTCQPHSLIVVPQLLMAMATLAGFEMIRPDYLRMVAVGGGKVSGPLLAKAEQFGIPVFEGYGLSEAGSVVTLNLPGATRKGSVGRVLPHAEIRTNSMGELEVKGAVMNGYLQQEPRTRTWLATGDLGHIDDDGFVFIDGRRKNMFITAFGRNVNPEWVEAELSQTPAIAHVMVYGEGMTQNLALIWPRFDVPEAELNQIVEETNERLPDYARIHDVQVMQSPLEESLITANGRLKRESVISQFQSTINRYAELSGNLPAVTQREGVMS